MPDNTLFHLGESMRVLVIASPGLGHLFPTVPLAHAFRAAGHEVRFATGGLGLSATDAGMNVVDVTPGLDYGEIYMSVGGDDNRRPIHADDPEDELLARLFGRVSSVMVDGALDVARSWSPDLIFSPVLQGAGPLVAAATGTPLVEMPVGVYDSRHDLGDMIREAMRADYDRHSVSADARATVRLSMMPPSFAELLPPERRNEGAWPMRWVPYNGGFVLPDWLRRRPDRPRIAVTLGTIEAQWGGIAMLSPLMTAAGGVDAEFVVTLGGGDVALLGDLPDNVRTVEWAPLDALLETCTAIIHHGGSGTTMTAIAAGIPQCVIPQGSYQHTDVGVVARLGTGIVAEAETLGARECRTLLTDEGMRKAAARAREELLTMPAPAELVPRLAALAGPRPATSEEG
ncbi:glycosyl transferase [Streptomyces nigrescens]|uniref:Glycosyl transferase n=2 Tax=Streptomyces TaxID=1883 RepID=A0ABM7ZY19_STRNI|nr:nucleotide disphospho-sugar-binding domain-containing protein [Streptomyces nigrescens]MEE4421629.1 nucleotide disphospho-sugar-binding domain-containing protein [Streptomyces sp. DSM 41528]BDM71256.1 glycosyl transferase [Streptomyces nigrescens]